MQPDHDAVMCKHCGAPTRRADGGCDSITWRCPKLAAAQRTSVQPFYEQDGITLYTADCRAVLPLLPDHSVDALVTDPPAGIAFMGKDWDNPWEYGIGPGDGGSNERGAAGARSRVAVVSSRNPVCRNCHKMRRGATKAHCECPQPDFDDADRAIRARQQFITVMAGIFRECRRVLKPGGHALVWGLPRTSHWTATALEDAGFEIRDCVTHLFGQGFPKSLDVGKALDKARQDNPGWRAVGAWLRTQRTHADMSAKAVCAAIGAHGDVNHGGALSNWENGLACPTWEQWGQLKTLLHFDDTMDAEVWRLNGRKGQPGEAWYEREVVGHDGRTAHSSWLGTQDGINGKWGIGEWTLTAPATDLARQWDGWGTALKPSAEFWWLARAPLSEPTIAQNVARWGTGALNIDGCRIAHGADVDLTRQQVNFNQMGYAGARGTNGTATYKPAGRWPANTILSHTLFCEQVGTRRVRGSTGGGQTAGQFGRNGVYGAASVAKPAHAYAAPDGTEEIEAWACAEDCPVRLLDAQSGERKSGGTGNGEHGYRNGLRGNVYARTINSPREPDVGGASRFFKVFPPDEATRMIYQAKPSRRERDSGLDRTLTVKYNIPPDAKVEICEATVRLLAKVTCDTAIENWHIDESGASIMVQCHRDSLSTTLTAIRQIMTSGIYPWLMPSPTNESIADVNCATANGGSPADGVVSSSPPTVDTIAVKMASAPSAESVASAVLHAIINADAWQPSRNIHSTVKSIALMRYLIRLITPPGGIILDPFAGSGSTLLAARAEGCRAIGIEQQEDYCATAVGRLGGALAVLTE